jgi:glycosyltransferase involved in cell wall biosynthesis
MKKISVGQIGSSDSVGGAARATLRIHEALNANEEKYRVASKFFVRRKYRSDPGVYVIDSAKSVNTISLSSVVRRIGNFTFYRRLRRFKTGNPTIHSFCTLPTDPSENLNALPCDLFNFHWLGSDVISIKEIAKLHKPIVWTLHDQWAFCGAEHYNSLPPVVDRRYIDGYLRSNRPNHESGPDLNRETWHQKLRHWHLPMHIVCPSNWMAECARQSVLMKTWPIRCIPNPIDTNLWRPIDRTQACKVYDLDPGKRYLIFGACGGTSDPRKGGDLILEALKKLKAILPLSDVDRLELIVFGENEPASGTPFPFDTHYFGNVQDDIKLVSLYCVGDVMLIPSRQDNLPNTGLEAQACGIPVISWDIGGLPDIVAHGKTGIMVKPFDTSGFAHAIRGVTSDRLRLEGFRKSSRERAISLWSPAVIASQYAALYREVMEQSANTYARCDKSD